MLVKYLPVSLLFLIMPAVINAQTGLNEFKSGVHQSINEDGTVTEYTYKNYLWEGASKTYYADGKVHFEGKHKDGMKEGLWNYYTYNNDDAPVVYKFYNYKTDTLDGSFFRLSNDTILKGHYSNGKLNGAFKRFMFSATGTGDTLFVQDVLGEYRNGKMGGHWKLFAKGILSEEGDYLNDLKSGVWKTYGLHSSNPALPEVMKETRYRKGAKNGREIQYFRYEKKKVPCKKPQPGNCYEYKKVKIYVEAIFDENKLQGTYIEKDAQGKVIAKGEYIEGFKVGKWHEKIDDNSYMDANYFDGRLAGPVVYKDSEGKITLKGSYANDIKNSKWSWYNKDGVVIKEYNYDHGKLSGDCYLYSASGTKEALLNFEDGILTLLVKYDGSGKKALLEYEIELDEPQENWVTCMVKENSGDTVEYTAWQYERATSVNHETFEEEFLAAKQDPQKCYKHGTYEKSANDMMLYSGEYTRNKKDGLWEYYYHEKITWQKTFTDGKRIKEFFVSGAKKLPFEGDYILNYPSGGIKSEFKIKEGYRNGKSKYYDKQGIVFKTKKYKEGILQK